MDFREKGLLVLILFTLDESHGEAALGPWSPSSKFRDD